MSDSAAPLRLGVWCAVLGPDGLLLSKRSDLNVWALPGGRLDAGEALLDAAAREVEEETGVGVARLRLAGLYYMAGWRRLNVLCVGEAAGGALLRRTDETRDNRFFPLNALPRLPLAAPVEDVVADRAGQMRIVRTSRLRRWQLRARFGVRYIGNALRGHPEPAYPRFAVSAAIIVSEGDGGRVLTTPGAMTAAGQLRALPRLDLAGEPAPWEAVGAFLLHQFGAPGPLRWAGLWQDAAASAIEFIFTCRADVAEAGEWAAPRLAALEDRDAAYLARPADGPPWLIDAHRAAGYDQPLRPVRR